MSKRLVILIFLFIGLVLFNQQFAYAVDIQLSYTFSLEISAIELYLPYKIALSPDNQIIIIDKKPDIHFFDRSGEYKTSWTEILPEEIDRREDITITFDQEANYYLTLEDERIVLKYSKNHDLLKEYKDESFSWIQTLLLTDQGDFYLADNTKLMLISQEGEIKKTFDDLNLWQPGSLKRCSDGNIYIADTNNKRILIINPEGQLLNQLTEFTNPITIDFDNKDHLFALETTLDDEHNSWITILSKEGKPLKVFNYNTNPEIEQYPCDFLIHQNQLYLLDMAERMVKVYDIINEN